MRRSLITSACILVLVIGVGNLLISASDTNVSTNPEAFVGQTNWNQRCFASDCFSFATPRADVTPLYLLAADNDDDDADGDAAKEESPPEPTGGVDRIANSVCYA